MYLCSGGDEFNMKRKTRVKLAKAERFGFKFLIKLIGISAGSVLIAIAYNALVTPYGLLSGGIGGLSIMGHYLFGFPIYFVIFLLNIPLFIWGLKELDREFIFYSIIGTAALIIALPVTKPYIHLSHVDLSLAAIFSGVVIGLGVGIIMKFGGSSGGVDIVSIIMKKKANISVGAFSFYTNIFVLILYLCFFDLNRVLYTCISMWVSGKVTDAVLEGFNRKKSVTIISDKSEIIAERIMNEINRGVTYLEGYGGFTGERKAVINSIVNNFENAKLKEIISEEDPSAFVVITDAIEVAGKGFTYRNAREKKSLTNVI